MAQEILGYWFAASDILPHGDGRKVVIGETLSIKGRIVPCKNGFHCSVHPFDALQYAPGPMLYYVRLSGIIVVAHADDKHAASKRTALVRRDATEMLRAFARKMALSVIDLWDAPQIVHEYLESGDETKRQAAVNAARDAARAAADAADATYAAACRREQRRIFAENG